MAIVAAFVLSNSLELGQRHLFVGRFQKRSRPVRRHKLVHLVAAQRLVAVDRGAQLLGERARVCCEDQLKVFPLRHIYHLVLHVVDHCHVLGRRQLLGRAHHKVVQHLVAALRQMLLPEIRRGIQSVHRQLKSARLDLQQGPLHRVQQLEDVRHSAAHRSLGLVVAVKVQANAHRSVPAILYHETQLLLHQDRPDGLECSPVVVTAQWRLHILFQFSLFVETIRNYSANAKGAVRFESVNN